METRLMISNMSIVLFSCTQKVHKDLFHKKTLTVDMLTYRKPANRILFQYVVYSHHVSVRHFQARVRYFADAICLCDNMMLQLKLCPQHVLILTRLIKTTHCRRRK